MDLAANGAGVRIACRCGHKVELDHAQLMRLLRRRLPMQLQQAELRLVCVRCGRRGQRMRVVWNGRSHIGR